MKEKIFAILILVSISLFAETENELRIISMSPDSASGNGESQIIIEFNRDIAVTGEMNRINVPVKIEPSIKCSWRFLDSRRLSCDFQPFYRYTAYYKPDGSTLSAATSYKITASKGSLFEKQPLSEDFSGSFLTIPLEISSIKINQWIDENTPMVKIKFNMPVKRESVMKSIFLTGKNSGKKYPLDALPELEYIKKGDLEDKSEYLLAPFKTISEPLKVEMDGGIIPSFGNIPLKNTKDLLDITHLTGFRFNGIKCSDGDSLITHTSGGSCKPYSPVYLTFSRPLKNESELEKIIIKTDGQTPSLKEISLEDEMSSFYSRNYYSRDEKPEWEFRVDISQYLKSGKPFEIFTQTYTPSLTEKILRFFSRLLRAVGSFFNSSASSVATDKYAPVTDIFGKELENEISGTFFLESPDLTGLSLKHPVAVAEKKENADILADITNIETILVNYNKITSFGTASDSLTKSPALKPDAGGKIELGIREILEGGSGIVQGKVSYKPFNRDFIRNYNGEIETENFLFIVSPFNITAKIGYENSLVWVTDLETGKPVENANVSIYNDTFSQLTGKGETIASGTTGKNGTVYLPGTSTIDPEGEKFNYYIPENKKSLFLKISKGSDLVIMPFHYNFMLSGSGINNINSYPRHLNYGYKSYGFTEQGIYRLGETIKFRLIVRDSSGKGLKIPEIRTYDLAVSDPQDNDLLTRTVNLDEFGSYTGEINVPSNAPVGLYRFILKDRKEKNIELYPLTVLVTDFKGAKIKFNTSTGKKTYTSSDRTIDVTAGASFNSGGPYSKAPVNLNLSMEILPFYPDTEFTQEYDFEPDYADSEDFQEKRTIGEKKDAFLDDQGKISASFEIPALKHPVYFARLAVSGTLTDDNGAAFNAGATAHYFGAEYFAGIKNQSRFIKEKKPAEFSIIVVDSKSKPVDKVTVKVEFKKMITKVAKVKGPGNAYLDDFHSEYEKKGECSAVSNSLKGVSCYFTPDSPGYYKAITETVDRSGKISRSQTGFYVEGMDFVPWETEENRNLEIIEKKSSWKVGETAEFLVKNPFPEALALITVEREGVLESFVSRFTTSTPVISFPVKEEYTGGIYVSVTVASPRIPYDKKDNKADLGKPSFKTGYRKVAVEAGTSRLKLHIESDRNIYQPGEKAVITVKNPTAQKVASTLIIINEDVLNLIKEHENIYNLYDRFYDSPDLTTINYSLLLRLIGIQKVETKGDTSGGDGGSAGGDFGVRTNLKNSIMFKNIVLDPDTSAKITVELPDNLTRWRAILVSFDSSFRFGFAGTSFIVNKDLEIIPNMPNFVYEGDNIDAGFTVVNRTETEKTVSFEISDGKDKKTAEYRLKPFERKSLFLNITAPELPFELYNNGSEINFSAVAKSGQASDAVKFILPVKQALFPKTFSKYGFVNGKTVETIKVPENARTGFGNFGITLVPTVISDIEPVFNYMKKYPYSCFEQKLSIALTALYYKKLLPYIKADFKWSEADDLIEKTLKEAKNFQAQNGGFSYFIAEDRYTNYYLSAYAAFAFEIFEKDGFEIDSRIKKALHSYLIQSLKQGGISSKSFDDLLSARALAASVLALTSEVNTDDLMRIYGADGLTVQAKIHLIPAFIRTGNRKQAGEIIDSILKTAYSDSGKISLQGGLFGTNHINCILLSAISEFDTQGSYSVKASMLARTVTASKYPDGSFMNTHENALCLKALADYSSAYEKEKGNITAKITFNNKTLDHTFKNIKDRPVEITKKIEKEDREKEHRIALESSSQLYYTSRILYSHENAAEGKAYSNGFFISREYHIKGNAGQWNKLKAGEILKKGDDIKTVINLSVPVQRKQVVVDDPVPAIFEPLNPLLATQSESGNIEDNYYFYYNEMRFDSMRFYAEHLPAGSYTLSYTSRVTGSGKSVAIGTKVLEMYFPENSASSDSLMLQSSSK